MIEVLRKLADMLEPRERRGALLLLAMMIVMALLEAGGVASVVPFFAVVSNPAVVLENNYLNLLYESLGFASVDDFLLYLGGAVFLLVVGSLVFRALTQWAMAYYVQMRGFSISSRLLSAYLARPYGYFLNQHSADLGKSVLLEAHQVVKGALMPAAQLIANSILAAFLFGVVLASGPKFALAAVGLLGGAYALIYLVVRRYLGRIGQERILSNRGRFQVAQEALGGIKDVKVLGLEGGYLRSFLRPARRYARAEAASQVVGLLPQFLLQALAFGSLILFFLFELVSQQSNLSDLLPVMVLYAFAALRLLPALQRIYLAVTQIRYARPALDALHADLMAPGSSLEVQHALEGRQEPVPLPLRDSLQLEGISFTYPQVEGASVRDLTVSIPARSAVAFVGPTGAGKTTVIDIILGLLEPQEGKLLVDGVRITTQNLRAWQRNIGYVPQNIFLSDDTIAANIAFGVPPIDVDPAAVERAARVASLHDFIVNETAKGYNTMVGERGVRLSGGQRQRIGIARALYRNPDVLVLDEATSALDSLTEKAVMDAMQNMSGQKTVILISHRLSIVRTCDTIHLLETGRLKASGTYEGLLESEAGFRSMAAV